MSAGYCPPADHPIFVDGVALNVSGGGQHGAVGVRVRHIMGWIAEGVEVRDTREAKPGRDGEHADEQYLGGRTITFEGTVTGSTYANLQSRKQTLAATFNRIAYAEGVVKLPDPDTAAPSFTHADTMTGFERVEARLVGGGVVWGERFGTWGQRFSVSVRASDPLIYSDTETTDADGSFTYSGSVATPPVVVTTLGLNSAWDVINESSSQKVLASLGDTSTFDDPGGSPVPSPQFVVDVANRDAYFRVPHAQGRTARLSALAHWKLNETSGATADNFEGTAARDGTYVGSPTLNQTGPFTGSKAITIAAGGSQYVSIPYTAALHPSEFTVDGWFKSNVSLGYAIKAPNGTQGYTIYVTDDLVQFIIGTASGERTLAAARATGAFTAWTHVAMTHKDGVVRCYLGGELLGTTRVTFTAATSGAMVLGGSISGALAFVGSLSSWSVIGRALSPAEVLPLADATDGLFAWRVGAGAYAEIQDWLSIEPGVVGFRAEAGSIASVTFREARL